MITDEELKWRLWTETPEFPKLDDHKKLVDERFLERVAECNNEPNYE